jgi:hypothetical protein
MPMPKNRTKLSIFHGPIPSKGVAVLNLKNPGPVPTGPGSIGGGDNEDIACGSCDDTLVLNCSLITARAFFGGRANVLIKCGTCRSYNVISDTITVPSS